MISFSSAHRNLAVTFIFFTDIDPCLAVHELGSAVRVRVKARIGQGNITFFTFWRNYEIISRLISFKVKPGVVNKV